MERSIRELVPCVRRELEERDTDHDLFHGSWDWHSSAHGHWALLRASEVVGDADNLSWVVDRIRSPAMAAELTYLERHPDFERPYGRAWLLRLMRTFERHTDDDRHRPAVNGLAQDLFQGVVDTALSPDTPEYLNPSWALIQLHAWATHAADRDLADRVEAVVAEGFTGPAAPLSRDGEGGGEFFSLWGVRALLIQQVLGDAALRTWLDNQSVDPTQVPLVSELRCAHHLAIHASRAWGLWACAQATSEPAWTQAYARHVEASLALHGPWEHDRRAYAHWVPQFTLYALLLPVGP